MPPPIPATAPLQAGQGRLVVDVLDGPVAVQRIRMDAKPVQNGRGRQIYRLFEVPALLCGAAPCVADVPIGNVLLGFPVIGNSALEVELVNVGPDPSVYRRTLSVYEDHTGTTRVLGIIFTAVGASAAITGTALLPIGLSKGNDTMTIAGGITLGGGLAMLALGIWAIRSDAPTFRPGSSNHFSLAAPPQ